MLATNFNLNCCKPHLHRYYQLYNRIRDAPDLDPDPAGYKNIRIRQNPDPAGSKQSGSGQPDPDHVVPITVSMHFFITQCQTKKTSDKLH